MKNNYSPKFNLRDSFTSFSFLIPALLLFFVFYIYTFFDLIRLSFMKSTGLPNTAEVFVWFKNYVDVLKDKIWWNSFGHAAIITTLALTFQNLLALILALLIDKGIRCQSIYRVIFFLPPVLSGIVVGLVWERIYFEDGLLNYWLRLLHLDNLCTDWLTNPDTALYAVAFIHMWKGFGWGFIILLAGLQNIDRELYEAADVDGAATWWPKFIHITVPLMMPVFVLVSILTILGTMQIFDLIISTTNGGPGYHTQVPITRIFSSMEYMKYGPASAQSIIFGVILLFVSITQIKISSKYKQD